MTVVLVCGGCGYIGSHLVRELAKLPEYKVVVLDNLSTGRLLMICLTHVGHRSVVPASVPVEVGDIRDKAFLDSVFKKHSPQAVMVKNFHLNAVAFLCLDRCSRKCKGSIVLL
jgi:UDP-glucose 4-epimerase